MTVALTLGATAEAEAGAGGGVGLLRLTQNTQLIEKKRSKRYAISLRGFFTRIAHIAFCSPRDIIAAKR